MSQDHPTTPKTTARLDGLYNALTGLGGSNDKGAVARPSIRADLTLGELDMLYRQNGYARRIVNEIPQDCVRKGWAVVADDEDLTQTPETSYLCIPERVEDAFRWARLYGGAVLLLVTRDGGELSDPLDLATVQELVQLHVFDAREATPVEWDGDIYSKTYREPLFWSFSPNTVGGSRSMSLTANEGTLGAPLTRPRVKGGLLSGEQGGAVPTMDHGQGLDDSVLNAIWDQLRNKASVEQGGACLAQELKIDTVKVEGLASLAVSDQMQLFQDRLSLLAKSKALLNTIVLATGEEYIQNHAQTGGFRDLDAATRAALSAVTGMPQTLLFGDTPSGLNSDGRSSQNAWATVISAIQTHYLKERLKCIYDVLFSSAKGPTGGPYRPIGWCSTPLTSPPSWRLNRPGRHRPRPTRSTLTGASYS